jgi:hypothetical protein
MQKEMRHSGYYRELAADVGLSNEAVYRAPRACAVIRVNGCGPTLVRLRETPNGCTRSIRTPTKVGHGGDSHTFM